MSGYRGYGHEHFTWPGWGRRLLRRGPGGASEDSGNHSDSSSGRCKNPPRYFTPRMHVLSRVHSAAAGVAGGAVKPHPHTTFRKSHGRTMYLRSWKTNEPVKSLQRNWPPLPTPIPIRTLLPGATQAMTREASGCVPGTNVAHGSFRPCPTPSELLPCAHGRRYGRLYSGGCIFSLCVMVCPGTSTRRRQLSAHKGHPPTLRAPNDTLDPRPAALWAWSLAGCERAR